MTTNDLTQAIRESLADVDECAWPEAALGVLTQHNVWANSVSAKWGGAGASSVTRLEAYERVAAGSLSLALILTQHDAACELLGDCENEAVARALLPRCARGDALLTVGISQLTTSRQRKAPAMRARAAGDSFVFDGVMPWVTSGGHADHVVTGAVLADGRQVLACVPIEAEGIRVGERFSLMALSSSYTCPVYCEDATIGRPLIIRGPTANVLARRAPVKGLTVTSVGLGHARAMIELCGDYVATLPGPAETALGAIEHRLAELRARLLEAARTAGDPEVETPTTPIRAEVNDLLARVAATLMTLAKGSGYVSGERPERLVREAMFFCVWSATYEVRAQSIARLWADHTGAREVH